MVSALALATALLSTAAPAEEANPFLGKARQLLQSYNEDEALKVLDKAIKWPRNSPHELAQAHLLMGLAWAAKADETKCIESFKAARLLEPNLELGSEHAPRVREWFERAGGPTPKLAPDEVVKDAPTKMSGVEPLPADTPALTPLPVAHVEPAKEPQPATARVGLRWAGIAGAAGGVAVVIVGATQGALANDRLTKSVQLSGLAEAQQEHQQAVAAAQRANWLYAIGGGILLAGTACLIVSF